MKNICIISDKNYILYGISLIDSLYKYTTIPIKIHYLAIDKFTYNIISKLYKDISVYNEDDVLRINQQLVEIKNTDRRYYMWTLASEFSKYIINNIECDSVTYIDSDIMFYDDIKYLYNQINDKDVGIFRHRFHNDLQIHKQYSGEFNVGVVYFKNSIKGREILNWWNDAVLYRKYPQLANCGDQQYLDAFPQLCKSNEIYIDDNIGHAAPWNWNAYNLEQLNNNKIIYNNQIQNLLFIHFSKFKYDFKTNTYDLGNIYNCFTENGTIYNHPILRKIHNEYFEILKVSNEKMRFAFLDKDIKIAVGMIVFEGDYVLEQCIKQIYPHVNQILISEGPVTYWRNKGRTASTDNTNNILHTFPDPQNKIKVIHGQYNEKNEQANAYCKYINDDIDYLWMIDSDEVYKTVDIFKLKQFLILEKPTSMGIKSCTFYGGFNNVLTGFENNTDNFIRIFKFMKGSYWESHRPPTIHYNAPIEKKHITSDELFKKTGIQFYHYSYVFPNQVKKKIDYYANSGVFVAGGVINNYFNSVYLPWVIGNNNDKLHIEKKYQGVHEFIPQRRGDCYTEYFNSEHPETIKESLNILQDIFNKELKLFLST